MNPKDPKPRISKPLLVLVLQWFYLLLGIAAGSSFLWLQKLSYISQLNLPNEVVIAAASAVGFYCLILALSFLTQNNNLLILSLVLIFFTTIGSGIMLAVTIPNAQTILSGNLPECASKLSTCNVQDGVVVASAMLMTVSVPTLLLNLITIVGAVKAIAASD